MNIYAKEVGFKMDANQQANRTQNERDQMTMGWTPQLLGQVMRFGFQNGVPADKINAFQQAVYNEISLVALDSETETDIQAYKSALSKLHSFTGGEEASEEMFRFPEDRETHKAILALDAPERIALTLHYLQGKRLQEISRIIGCSELQAQKSMQAGLLHHGHAALWPHRQPTACLETLRAEEKQAIALHKGRWETVMQSRALAAISRAEAAQMGRRFAMVLRVKDVRPWHEGAFVNFMPSFHGAPSVLLTSRQMEALRNAQRDPYSWQGKRLLIRAVVNEPGLRKLRIESIDQLLPID